VDMIKTVRGVGYIIKSKNYRNQKNTD